MVTEKLRAVLDTNVPVAAHLSVNPNSPAVELIERWRRGEFMQLYSDDTIAELEEKLTEKGIGSEAVEEYLSDLAKFGVHVKVGPEDIEPVIPADPDDDLIVACAVVGGATHCDLRPPLRGPGRGTQKGIEIVDGLAFLRRVRGEELTEGS